MLRRTSLDSILSQINPIHILASHLGQNDLQKYLNSRIIMRKLTKINCNCRGGMGSERESQGGGGEGKGALPSPRFKVSI
jgi:hypothetical protein